MQGWKAKGPEVHCLYKSMKQELELQDGHEYHFPGASDEAGSSKRCQLQITGWRMKVFICFHNSSTFFEALGHDPGDLIIRIKEKTPETQWSTLTDDVRWSDVTRCHFEGVQKLIYGREGNATSGEMSFYIVLWQASCVSASSGVLTEQEFRMVLLWFRPPGLFGHGPKNQFSQRPSFRPVGTSQIAFPVTFEGCRYF